MILVNTYTCNENNEKLKTHNAIRKIRTRNEWSERIEHIEENWESSRPILFENVVMRAGVPPLPVRIGFSL